MRGTRPAYRQVRFRIHPTLRPLSLVFTTSLARRLALKARTP